jgi:hypothetical protein
MNLCYTNARNFIPSDIITSCPRKMVYLAAAMEWTFNNL